MPAFGGLHPFPRRFGGGWHRLEGILKSLNQQVGTAYGATVDQTSTVYARNMAIARMIHGAWATNERLGRLWDGQRMPDDIVARWESILAIRPRRDTTMQARRERVAEVFASQGLAPLPGILTGLLEEKLGDFFIAVENISFANAVITVPDGTYPWGSVVSGAPWSSTVAHILVLLQKPTGYTEAEFYEQAGRVFSIVDAFVPAWVTIDWYREPVSGGISVSGGPSEGGFFLDDEHNLDNCVFDV